jgi:CBS domain-containing protein
VPELATIVCRPTAPRRDGGTEETVKDTLHTLLEQKGHKVHTISPGETVLDAVRKMNHERIGALLVLEGGDLVGIFTERDVLTRVVDQARDPSSTSVADVMTSQPVVVTSRATISEAMAVVSEKRCRHLPVVEEGRLIGLVSAGDLTHWLTRNQEYHIQDLTNYITRKYPG